MSFRIVITCPNPWLLAAGKIRGLVGVAKQLLCLVLVFVHHHTAYRRPGLAQCEITVTANVVLVYEAVQVS